MQTFLWFGRIVVFAAFAVIVVRPGLGQDLNRVEKKLDSLIRNGHLTESQATVMMEALIKSIDNPGDQRRSHAGETSAVELKAKNNFPEMERIERRLALAVAANALDKATAVSAIRLTKEAAESGVPLASFHAILVPKVQSGQMEQDEANEKLALIDKLNTLSLEDKLRTQFVEAAKAGIITAEEAEEKIRGLEEQTHRRWIFIDRQKAEAKMLRTLSEQGLQTDETKRKILELTERQKRDEETRRESAKNLRVLGEAIMGYGAPEKSESENRPKKKSK